MSIAGVKARIVALDAAARPWAERSRLRGWAYELLLFGLKQAWACLYGGLMLLLLVGTFLLYPRDAPLARYDFLVLAALAIQIALLWFRLETWTEAAVIFVFHVVGTAMEIYKTAHGSWTYPEHSLLRIGGVPLFTGFMYGCVGSYIARALRLLDIRFSRRVRPWALWLLAVGAYANFFADNLGIDVRWLLLAASFVIFGRVSFWYRPDRRFRRMPIVLGFGLVALFIWFAENAGTFAHIWIYPIQQDGWRLVPPEKMISWYLLMLLSFVLVMTVRRPPVSAARPVPVFARRQPHDRPVSDGLGIPSRAELI
jgi:uncharacterized membrane protein YoaT (DUF817 family)